MTADDAIRDFATSSGGPPLAAVQWALDNWDEAGPRLLSLLEGYVDGTDISQQTEQALFFALHLLAEKGKTDAFVPLCRLLKDAETADLVLGDMITENLHRILISLFDGDAAALRTLIETEQADDFVRDAAMVALSYLTRIGRVANEETHSFLRCSLDGMMPQEPHIVWMSWVMAVARLGYRDLAGAAETMIRNGRVPDNIMDVSLFREDLRRTLDDPTGMAGFVHDRIGPFEDIVGEMARWAYVNEQAAKLDKVAPGSRVTDWQEPVVNPLRGVGRNDPCPCGSGKKFKKCCLV